MRTRLSILLIIFLLAGYISYPQTDTVGTLKLDTLNPPGVDSTKQSLRFGAAVLLTNNGISPVPTFSLGEPAVLFNLLIAKKRFSFEPDIRFSLKGKPWTFVFWFRYRLIEKSRFMLNVGIHPAYNFRTIKTAINGDSTEILQTRRFLAAEIAPNYFITKYITVGVYYLHSRGFDYSAPEWTQFFTINANFSNIQLNKQFYLRFIPQVYYLKQDELDGYYWTASLGIAHRKFPLTLMALFNQTIESEIVTKDFVWSLNLIYSFNKVYVPLQ